MYQRLKYVLKTMKHLGKNIGVYLCDLGSDSVS